MIPYLLSAVGGYLIGGSTKEVFEEGGVMAMGGALQDVADALMEIDADVWDYLNVRSGSELKKGSEKQGLYYDALETRGADDVIAEVAVSERKKVHDILEDENHHSLNTYLAKKGYYGKSMKASYDKY
jgi:hypothetical protein